MLRTAELKPAAAALKARARAAGKPEPEIIVRRALRLDDASAARAKLDADREAGAGYFILDLGRYADESEFARSVEIFMGKVAA